MSEVLQGTPIKLIVKYVNVDAAPPPAEQAINGPLIAALGSQLPREFVSLVNSQWLTTPLDQVFANTWAGRRSEVPALIEQGVHDENPGAYDFSHSIPQTGTLVASVGPITPYVQSLMSPPVSGKQLYLQYQFSGFVTTFNVPTDSIFGSYLDPRMRLSFDAEIRVVIVVPDVPYEPLRLLVQQFTTLNISLVGDHFFSTALLLKNLVNIIKTGNPFRIFPSNISSYANIGTLQQLVDTMSAGFARASTFGFRHLDIDIDGTQGQNALRLILTHDFDPAPVVAGDAPPSAQGQTFRILPTIGTDRSVVRAGETVLINGVNFPAVQTSGLTFGWTDTTSGNIAMSEVEYGPSFNSSAPPPSLVLNRTLPRKPYDNGNNFPLTGLAPNAAYAFRVRDYDLYLPNMPVGIATAWSKWTVLHTHSPSTIQLSLVSSTNQSVSLGTIQLDSTGRFAQAFVIPAGVQPGNYNVVAARAYKYYALLGGGGILASAPLTVIGATGDIPATLQIIDPQTQLPALSLPFSIMEGGTLHLRGRNFVPNQSIDFFVDSGQGQNIGQTQSATGDFDVNLKWPLSVLGTHSVLARQGATEVKLPLYVQMIPR